MVIDNTAGDVFKLKILNHPYWNATPIITMLRMILMVFIVFALSLVYIFLNTILGFIGLHDLKILADIFMKINEIVAFYVFISVFNCLIYVAANKNFKIL